MNTSLCAGTDRRLYQLPGATTTVVGAQAPDSSEGFRVIECACITREINRKILPVLVC
jgi:hypothetical protein